jgi:hypothetical protein
MAARIGSSSGLVLGALRRACARFGNGNVLNGKRLAMVLVDAVIGGHWATGRWAEVD